MTPLTESLFAAVYADPDRDEPRSVLADHLIELGDPRGEFIALQLARARTGGTPSQRERALLKAHGAKWTGHLERIFAKTDREFARGFLARGRAEGQWKIGSPAKHAMPSMIGLVEWSTVEGYACPNYYDDRVVPLAELFSAPAMRSLRVLHNIPANIAVEIEKSATPPPLVEIAIQDYDRYTDQLGETGLRGVRSLIVCRVISLDRINWLWTCPLWPRLEAITLTGYHSEPLTDIVEYLGAFLEHAPPSLRRIGFMGQTRFPWSPEGWHVELERDDRGAFSRLSAAFGACTYGYAIVGDQLADALDKLSVGSLTSIEIRETRAYKPTDEQTVQLARARQRHGL